MSKYEAMFKSMVVRPSVAWGAKTVCTEKIKPNKVRYQLVADDTGVPWWWIACVHHMESDCRFDKHLHNGDPLTARTVHVPSGRPIEGNPPFTWEESAVDALKGNKAVAGQKTWKLENALWLFEKFNGMGYELHGVTSPYVWSGCQHYAKGRYVADGVWDAESVSEQIGAAVILKELVNIGEVVMSDTPVIPMSVVPVSTSDVTIPLLANALKFLQGPIGAMIMAQAIDPNSLLNTFAHQNFWLGLAVTAIGGVLQHLKTDSTNKNTVSALGFTSSPQ